mmetsp:Transcript_4250/g.8250  ORF Transcript_4250/g.8250 Transcript_4250/m.8250 type:complete len:210 (+) Transcript_4250:55-684(+)
MMVGAEPSPPLPFLPPPLLPSSWAPPPPPLPASHAVTAAWHPLADLGAAHPSPPRPVCSFSEARLHACAERIRIYVEVIMLLLLLVPLSCLLRTAWAHGRAACGGGDPSKRGKLREGREHMTLLAKRARRALRRAPRRKCTSLSSIAEEEEEERMVIAVEEEGAATADLPSPLAHDTGPDGSFPQGSPKSFPGGVPSPSPQSTLTLTAG